MNTDFIIHKICVSSLFNQWLSPPNLPLLPNAVTILFHDAFHRSSPRTCCQISLRNISLRSLPTTHNGDQPGSSMTNPPAPPIEPQTSQPFPPGTVIGRFTIHKLLNETGMGVVYQATHNNTGRAVVLKVMSPEALQDPESLDRFQREAQAKACLDHPNIVTTLDVDQAGDLHFLVKQYVDGDDLWTTVKNGGPLEVDTALRYMMHAALGLGYLHKEGVVHRDVKPSNLIVGSNGVVKILGLGLARLPDASAELSQENAGSLLGTIDFMAPEQALDANDADQRADIYSLGCTFYCLLTGQAMYGGDSKMKRIAAHRSEPIPSLRAVRSDVPEELDAVFQKMVAKDRQDRYQSMSEVLAAIAPFGASW